MLKHIVMWTLKEEYDGMKKDEMAQKMKEAIEDLKDKIPEIKEMEVGLNFNYKRKGAHDIVLISTFDDKEALQRYLKHPEHVKVVELVKNYIDSNALVDYIV